MNDYIDRQAAIDALEERIQANGYSNAALVSEFNRSIGYLMRLPSAEVEPVKHGRWIDCGLYGDYFPHHEWECSSCHECVIDTDRPWYAYCPSCGARMDLEGEDHEQD